ncbi:S-layer family protein [Scytonema tolypothrichoides VB-61278]|nr:S-layer family protein [Scytonema tolypothrichoides VB-61278]
MQSKLQVRHPFLFLALPLATLASLSYFTVAKAQITPDNSLGAENSVVTPNVQINGTPSDRIDGGATRGANLFHSFQEFNINAGRGAYFSNPAGIANILTRVTGGNISNIQGVLGVLGSANLFLINPNGILFGPNARLDVGGSFLGSTANSLLFKDGFEFSATNPQAPPLLTITAPVGLGFRNNPGSIQVQGNGQGIRSRTSKLIDTTDALRVPSDKTLALIGGDVSLQGATLKTAGGRIELGSVGGSELVSITPINNGFALGYGTVQNFGNIQLSQQTAVDASGLGGGDIQVRGRRITFSDGSQIETATLGSQKGGALVVNATEQVEAVGSSFDGNFPSGLFARVYEGATGAGGDITVNTNKLSIRDGAQVLADTSGQGNAGNVTVNATGPVTIAGVGRIFSSAIFTSVNTGATGNGGNITISSSSFSLTDDAGLLTDTAGKGNAGSVFLQAKDSVSIIGKGTIITTGVNTGGVGKAGDINIRAASLSIKDGAQLISAIFYNPVIQSERTDAGNVNIDVTGPVTIAGVNDQLQSGIFSLVSPGGVGNGGNIAISSGYFSLSDGAVLSTDTSGQGNAGNVSVRALGGVELAGSDTSISSTVGRIGVGNGGNININAPRVSLNDGAQITASSFGNGAAGDIEVAARSIRLDHGSTISANTVAGQGNIKLGASDYVLLRGGSNITTNARGENVIGGNININTDVLVGFDNSDITANSANSRGGNVQINTQGIFGFQSQNPASPNTSDITATGVNSQSSGNVQINVVDVDPTRGLFELLETIPDPAQQIAQNPCIKGFGSTFTIVGRGGIPTDPKKILSSDNVRVDLVKPVPSRVSSTSTTQKQPSQKPPVKEIIPAQGWIYNEKGEVLLVGYDPTKTGPQRKQPAPTSNCAAVK